MNRLWSESEDMFLRSEVAKGTLMKVIGQQLGRSKNACIGRMQRLRAL